MKKKVGKRFSIGHKLGLPYHPKKIIKGINLKKQELNQNQEKFACFLLTSYTVGGKNLTNKIRFSLDFGVIHKNNLGNQNKKFHFSSYKKNKSHYVAFNL